MDPQSRPGEFSSSEGSCGVTRRGPFAVNACRCCDLVRRRVHFLRARAPRPVSIGGQKIWRQVARADSFPPVGSYSLRNAGRRETEDRPAALRSCPCVHVSTCGYCLSGAVAANRVVRTGPGCVGCARWSVANRSVVHPTRLVTRTKESNMCASHWVLRNLKA